MNRIFLFSLLLLCMSGRAQVMVNFHLNTPDTTVSFPVSEIDSITYTNLDPGNPATLTTGSVSKIRMNSASIVGSAVNSNGGSFVYQYGVCYSELPDPEFNDSVELDYTNLQSAYTVKINNLKPNTVYYVRSFGLNNWGYSYGPQVSFTTLPELSLPGNGVTDIDGNMYPSVIVGTQEWMAENLRSSRFNDGTQILKATDAFFWIYNDGLPMFAWFDDSYPNASVHGCLYNYNTVSSTHNVCPTGWHVPSDSDWKTLESTLGMPAAELDQTGARGSAQNIAGLLKDVNPVYWGNFNSVATNQTLMNMKGGGLIQPNFFHHALNAQFMLWSSTQIGTGEVYVRLLTYDSGESAIMRELFTTDYGSYIRCVKD